LYENQSGLATYISCDLHKTGIDPAISIESLEVFPNPSSDFFRVNFYSTKFSSAEIKITDALGRDLLVEEIERGQAVANSTSPNFLPV
jgi:hypothetical protein